MNQSERTTQDRAALTARAEQVYRRMVDLEGREQATDLHDLLDVQEIIRTLLTALADRERLKQARNLALAHDTQPYLTAAAYEAVCAAKKAADARAEQTVQERDELQRLRLFAATVLKGYGGDPEEIGDIDGHALECWGLEYGLLVGDADTGYFMTPELLEAAQKAAK